MTKRAGINNRSWFKVHSWIGVVTGLLMFVICWSGTFATLSSEADWLLTPELRVTPAAEHASWGEIQRSVQSSYPQAEITGLSAPLYARSAATVGISLPNEQSLHVYVDPYTAEVQGASSRLTIQRFFRSFHMNLFNGKWGYYLVYSFGVLLLVSLITPLIFYKRWWRRFLALKTGRGPRVFWGDLHKLVGLWSLWFVLILAVTGSWYLVESLRGDVGDGKFSWVATGDFGVRQLPPRPVTSSDPIPLDVLLARVRKERPSLDIRSIRWDEGYLYVDGQDEHILVRDRANKLYLNPENGSVAFNQRASDQPAWWRWSDTADPLHFGDFGGLATKLIWFVFGVGLSGLSLTGAYLHMKRLTQAEAARKRARWPGTGAAIVVTLMVLAASAEGGWEEILSYGPTVGGVQHWPDVAWPVTAFIAAWIISTLAAIGWWSWLLWVPSAGSGDKARAVSKRLQPATRERLSWRF